MQKIADAQTESESPEAASHYAATTVGPIHIENMNTDTIIPSLEAAELENSKRIRQRSVEGREKRKSKKAKLKKARRASLKESQRQMNEVGVPLDAEGTDVTGKRMNPYGLVRGPNQLFPDAESSTMNSQIQSTLPTEGMHITTASNADTIAKGAARGDEQHAEVTLSATVQTGMGANSKKA